MTQREKLFHCLQVGYSKRLEARRGFEPLDKGFADLSLSHLGTSPNLKTGKKAAAVQQQVYTLNPMPESRSRRRRFRLYPSMPSVYIQRNYGRDNTR